MIDAAREAGMNIKEACRVLGVSRSGYYAVQHGSKQKSMTEKTKDMMVLERIRQLCVEHPFWGYRRITAWLRHREGIWINCKRVLRLTRQAGLTVKQKPHKARRTPQRSKPKAERPRQFWGIDMTKFIVERTGWLNLVVVLDWYTKKLVGHKVCVRGRTLEWKEALNAALQAEFPDGVRGSGLKLISDNGCQPTSVAFMHETATLGVEQIFTSYNNPKGNADTERFIRTIKEELLWIEEFHSVEEAEQKIAEWIKNNYNRLYVHSALGYVSPEEFEAAYYQQQMRTAA